MTNHWASKVAVWAIPAALFAWASLELYSAYLEHWQGNLRVPLIAGSAAGIAFVIVGTTVVRLQDRDARGARPAP